MSVLVMVWILWTGILGFIACCITVPYFFRMIFCKKDPDRMYPHIKHRDKWLLQHFGKVGRKRWLKNLEMAQLQVEFNNQYLWHYKKVVKRYRRAVASGYDFRKAHRTSDGGCSGIVILDEGNGISLFRKSMRPPWGWDYEEYFSVHNPDPLHHDCARYMNGGPYHGEPLGADWLAAGFWDPVTLDNGVVIDPISILKDDLSDCGDKLSDVVIEDIGGKFALEMQEFRKKWEIGKREEFLKVTSANERWHRDRLNWKGKDGKVITYNHYLGLKKKSMEEVGEVLAERKRCRDLGIEPPKLDYPVIVGRIGKGMV